MFITEFSLKLDPPQSSLRPWHGHRRRSASIGAVDSKHFRPVTKGLLFRDNTKTFYSEIFIQSHSDRVSPASQAIVAPHIKSCRIKTCESLLRQAQSLQSANHPPTPTIELLSCWIGPNYQLDQVHEPSAHTKTNIC